MLARGDKEAVVRRLLDDEIDDVSLPQFISNFRHIRVFYRLGCELR